MSQLSHTFAGTGGSRCDRSRLAIFPWLRRWGRPPQVGESRFKHGYCVNGPDPAASPLRHRGPSGFFPGCGLRWTAPAPEVLGRIRPIALRIGHPARREAAATPASDTQLVRWPGFSRCRAVLSPPPVRLKPRNADLRTAEKLSHRTSPWQDDGAVFRPAAPSVDTFLLPLAPKARA